MVCTYKKHICLDRPGYTVSSTPDRLLDLVHAPASARPASTPSPRAPCLRPHSPCLRTPGVGVRPFACPASEPRSPRASPLHATRRQRPVPTSATPHAGVRPSPGAIWTMVVCLGHADEREPGEAEIFSSFCAKQLQSPVFPGLLPQISLLQSVWYGRMGSGKTAPEAVYEAVPNAPNN